MVQVCAEQSPVERHQCKEARVEYDREFPIIETGESVMRIGEQPRKGVAVRIIDVEQLRGALQSLRDGTNTSIVLPVLTARRVPDDEAREKCASCNETIERGAERLRLVQSCGGGVKRLTGRGKSNAITLVERDVATHVSCTDQLLRQIDNAIHRETGDLLARHL